MLYYGVDNETGDYRMRKTFLKVISYLLIVAMMSTSFGTEVYAVDNSIINSMDISNSVLQESAEEDIYDIDDIENRDNTADTDDSVVENEVTEDLTDCENSVGSDNCGDFAEDEELILEENESSEYVHGDEGTILISEGIMYNAGNGTKSSPYEIATKEQFMEFYNNLSDRVSNDERADAAEPNTYTYYKLTSDIIFNDNLKQPQFIFDKEKVFDGFFDGDGHTLQNIVVERNIYDESYMSYFGGIFGVNRGVVKSVNIGDSIIIDTSTEFRGSITGITPFVGVNIGTVSFCDVIGDVVFDGSLQTTFTNAAGIVAKNKNGTVENCMIEAGASIIAKKGPAVGIVAKADSGMVDSCCNAGTVTALNGNVIGIVNAETKAVVNACKNLETGNVLAENGRAYGVCYGNGTVLNCENHGVVKGDFSTYGIGEGKTATNCINTGQLSYYNIERYELYGIELYGIGDFTEKIESCTNTADIVAKTDDGNYDLYGIGRSLNIINCVNEGALTGGYVYGIGWGYYGMEGCINKGTLHGRAVEGIGTTQEGEIKDCGNVADLYLVNSGEYCSAAGIGYSNEGYVGCYNTGNIEALGNNCYAYGLGELGYPGYVKNCYNTGNIKASRDASGLIDSVGYTSSIDDKYEYEISYSYNTGHIAATREAAGIALTVSGFGTIKRCFNTGTIIGNNGDYSEEVAGIVATMQCSKRLTKVEYCYNAGSIKSSNQGGTGGIIGYLSPFHSTSGYYSFEMKDCYNVGAVSGSTDNAINYGSGESSSFYYGEKLCGGTLIGYLEQGAVQEGYSVNIDGCYYRNDMKLPIGAIVRQYYFENSDEATRILSGIKSASESDMQKESTYTGWDFSNVWEMGTETYRYPMLTEEGGNTEEAQSGYVFWKIENGKLIINGIGNWELDSRGRAPWASQSKFIKEVQVISLKESTSLKNMFDGLYNVTSIDLSGLNTASVTNMSGMFRGCSKLKSVNVSNFDTSKVTDMSEMFSRCSELEFLDLSSFDLGMVESTKSMFNDCLRIKKIVFSNMPANEMKNIENMFFRCYKITELDLGNWDFSNVTNGYAAFSECTELRSIRTPKNVKINIRFNSGNTTLNDEDGNYYSALPENKTKSILLLSGVSYDASYNGGARTGKVKIEYSDFYLSKSSYTYNHNLARFAAKMAMMCYSSDNKMQATIDNLGYDGYEYYKFGTLLKSKKENSETVNSISDKAKEEAKERYNGDSSPYWIAHKTVYSETGTSTLVSVFIRGTSGEEWINNFKPERNETHAGFESAASKAKSDLSSYIERNHLDRDNIKYLITGHSRGAATANLLGAKLVDEQKAAGKNADNVYTYTFATPNVTKKVGVDAEGGTYSNIYNIVNPEDFVTKVFPTLWGYSTSNIYGRYRRYGKTLVLPSATTDIKGTKNYVDYKSYLKKIKAEFAKYAPGETYEPYKNGMIAVSDYVNEVYREIKNIDDYYDKKLSYVNPSTRMSDLYRNTLGNIMAGHMAEGIICYLDAAISYGYGHMGVITAGYFFKHEAMSMFANKLSAAITGTEVNQVMDEDFANAHRPETYIAAMEVLTERQLKQDRKTLYGITNCPVDVSVYDSEGNIVGQIVDNEIVDANTQIGMDVNGDSKRFFIPANEDYTVEITANDNGTLDYSLLEVDPDTGETGRVFYHNLDVSTDSSAAGSKYIQKISADTTLSDMPVKNANNVNEEAMVLGEDDLGQLSVNVTVEGEGEAASLSNLTPGDYATVYAYETENSIFKGWYDSTGTELLCTESEYGFSIAKDMNLVAKFENVPDGLRVEFDENNSYEYCGKAIVPEIKVFDKKTELKNGVDYTVKVKNNINAYTKEEGDDGFNYAKAPTVVVSGKGNYSGTINRTFSIFPIPLLDDEKIAYNDMTVEADSKGRAIKPIVPVICSLNGKNITLKSGKDIKYTYPDNGENSYIASGTYNVKIDAVEGGNYSGSINAHVTIIPLAGDTKLLSKQKISVGKAVFAEPYEKGAVAVPDANSIVIKDVSKPADDQILKGLYCESKTEALAKLSERENIENGYQYVYYCENNKAPGTAKITFIGVDANGYTGIVTKTYVVSGKTLNGISFDGLEAEYVYSGSNIEPAGSVDSDEVPEGFRIYKKIKNAPDEVLIKNINYAVEYSQNVDNGTATLLVKGINNYTGTVKKTFKIRAKESTQTNSQIMVSDITEQPYVKGGVKPDIVVTDATTGITLKEGKDFTLSYKNNKKIHTGLEEDDTKKNPAPRVIIKGKGNYSGSVEKLFGIKASSLSSGRLTMTATDIVYAKKSNICKPTITIYDSDGTKLNPKTDYNGTLKYFYVENDEEVKATDIIQPGTEIRAVAYGLETGFYSEKIDGLNQISTSFRFVDSSIAKASVSISAQTYTGKKIELSENDIIVKMKGVAEPLRLNYDYEIINDQNYVNIGNATVTIKGIGNYGGEKAVKFKITQKSMSYTINFTCDLEALKEKLDDENLILTGKDKTAVIPTGTKLPKCGYKLTGTNGKVYTFDGWCTKKNPENRNDGKWYNDQETFRLKTILQLFGRKETLYAQWK